MSLPPPNDRPPTEKRGAARIKTKHARLVYAKRGLSGLLRRRRHTRAWPVKDVSRSGVQFFADEELRIGLHLRITLRLDPEEDPIRFDAEVVRNGPGSANHAHTIGVRCVGFRDLSWHRLWEFLETADPADERQGESNGPHGATQAGPHGRTGAAPTSRRTRR